MRMTREYLKTMHAARSRKPWTVDRAPIQLGLGGDPWRILVACAMLNQTTNGQVRPVLAKFLELWPRPYHLARAPMTDVIHAVAPLGLQRRRSGLLVRAADLWLSDTWETDWDLPTVGPYCHAALSIFVGLDRDVRTDDRVLRSYVDALDAGLGLEEDM